MNRINKNQSGFGAIEALLLVVIVAIIGFAGWYVYNAQKDIDKNLTSNSSETPAINKKTTEPKDAVTGYLAIKEWGVKIPLSKAVAGAYYVVDKEFDQSMTNPTNLTVYAKEVDSITGPAGESCKGEYIAYVLRFPKDDTRWQPSESVDDGNVSPLYGQRTVVGDYRYAIATKKQYGPACFEAVKDGDYDADEATVQKFQAVVDAFFADFKNVVAE